MNRLMKSRKTFANLKIQLPIVVFVLTVAFISCKSDADNKQDKSARIRSENIPVVVTQNDAVEAVVKSLIGFSADDFYKNQQPLPTSFRNVQIKYSIKQNKEIMYILCGQFTTQDNQNRDEWTDFATIITDPYEQWIGSNALTYCEKSKEIRYTKAKLSTELKNKLNSLQKLER
ncbi:MAG: hypothetical protein IPN74_16250 [Haliscomenobacter sp.]|nr:hypothetical protein [Haliscomenobacter sp.]